MTLGLLVLRVIVGLLFVGHGAQKLFGVWGGHGLEGTGGFFQSLKLHPGRPMAFMAGAAEFGGGALIALGLLTPVGGRVGSTPSPRRSPRPAAERSSRPGWPRPRRVRS